MFEDFSLAIHGAVHVVEQRENKLIVGIGRLQAFQQLNRARAERALRLRRQHARPGAANLGAFLASVRRLGKQNAVGVQLQAHQFHRTPEIAKVGTARED